MNVAIPAEFEAFARRQIEAGVVASEEEAVAVALRSYLSDVAELQALIDPAIASLDRGEGIDGEQVFARLLAKYREMTAEPPE